MWVASVAFELGRHWFIRHPITLWRQPEDHGLFGVLNLLYIRLLLFGGFLPRFPLWKGTHHASPLTKEGSRKKIATLSLSLSKSRVVVSLSVHVVEPSSHDVLHERMQCVWTHAWVHFGKALEPEGATILQSVLQILPRWVKSNRVQRLQRHASKRHQALSGLQQWPPSSPRHDKL